MARQEQNKELKNLRQEVINLSNRLADFGMDAADSFGETSENFMSNATERVSDLFDRSKETLGNVKDTAVKKANQANDYAHENPWMIAAGAMAAGLVIGMFLSHRGNEEDND